MIRLARLCGVLASLLAAAPIQGWSASPDILLIVFDDLNDWVSPLGGHPQADTPNFERLARRGMMFTNAHVTAPLCNPSRASLMTGMLSSSLGVYEHRQDWREAPALRGKPALPEFMQRHGCHTLGGGKLFHAATVRPEQFYGLLPARGFDDYYPALGHQLPDEIRPLGRPVSENPGFISGFFDWAPVVAEDSAMGDGQVVEWAGRRLRAELDRPLFLAVGIYRPHIPWYVPQAYFDRHPLAEVELRATLPGDLDDVPSAERYASNQRVHQRFLTSFLRSTVVNEGTIKMKLRKSAPRFRDHVLPSRFELQVLKEIKPSDEYAPMQYRLAVAMTTIDEALRNANEEISNFVRGFQ